ncbi:MULTISPECIES: thiopurine S-methyltransferase [unclassified Vibrio]|uniref:Thiopurine S-methyltransferase n=1 Tax=Vibrio sp. HB236076 TaxID=3232307 RepID=A0AB39HD22_9VIBR|nr:thiopurine S-methyltransferase [Vibrio sp. HB161653]MDP5253476.1 thiopurine S-methyltransferase [Vibrio sp. HB161653]
MSQNDAFWQEKWASNQIGFHLPDPNPLLTQHWSALEPEYEQTVLVPLCGKSEDIDWLAERHQRVIGVELTKIAVRAYFAERFYTPMVYSLSGQHEKYHFDEVELIQGDFFTAPTEPVDLIYDRAALIALDEQQRQQYSQTLLRWLKPGGKVLLISLDYPQSQMDGPPFSVGESEIGKLFKGQTVTKLAEYDRVNSDKKAIANQLTSMFETVWLIEG